MNPELQEIRDKQKDSWDNFSPGWEKWDELTMKFLQPYGDEIIRMTNPGGSDSVLDIAAGTGEPGLTIATLTTGTVTVTDLSDGMLAIAGKKAVARGLTNLETAIADACELPFEDNTFDVVSCRFGFMFFPDMLLAAQEMARVLKPGGRVATSVWGAPEKNFWVTCMMMNIKQHIDMPHPPEGAPGMFRCAAPGFISDIFQQAGFQNVSEKEVTGQMTCESAEQYWDFMTEVAAPFVAALKDADEGTIATIRDGVIASMNDKYPDTDIDTSANVIYGEK